MFRVTGRVKAGGGGAKEKSAEIEAQARKDIDI